jgi:hypothetical protein
MSERFLPVLPLYPRTSELRLVPGAEKLLELLVTEFLISELRLAPGALRFDGVLAAEPLISELRRAPALFMAGMLPERPCPDDEDAIPVLPLMLRLRIDSALLRALGFERPDIF